jgi:phosphoglycolate phosphatase
VTNKPEAFAVELLDQAGLGRWMDFVFGADTHEAKKPDPLPLIRAAERSCVDPAQAIMVGDSVNDLKAAIGAGFRFVFARYGYSDPDDPTLQSEWSTIDRFGELERLLSR